MRKEISDLVAATQALQQQNSVLQAKVDAEVANSAALKQAYTAALQGQLTTEEREALAVSAASIAAVREQLGAAAQKLADSAAVNSPAN